MFRKLLYSEEVCAFFECGNAARRAAADDEGDLPETGNDCCGQNCYKSFVHKHIKQLVAMRTNMEKMS